MKAKLEAYYNDWLKVKMEISTEKEAIKAVESDGDALQYVKDQTPEVCLKAVESNGDALKYVRSAIFAEFIKETPTDVVVITREQIAEKFGISNFKIEE